MKNDLLIVVITFNPSDYLDKYVVRDQYAGSNRIAIANQPRAVVDTLEQARSAVPRGLVCFNRDAVDDPVIVESWL